MKLLFVRHGQTNANAGMLGGQPIQELDEPLNHTGKLQAGGLANELKGKKFDVILSSPLRRAQETAEAINAHHGVPIATNNDLRERDAGMYIDAGLWHELFDFDKNIPVQDGESLSDFFGRVYHCLDIIKQQYPDKTVVVVSHGGVHHAVYAYTNKLPLSGNMRISPMRNCDYREYEL